MWILHCIDRWFGGLCWQPCVFLGSCSVFMLYEHKEGWWILHRSKVVILIKNKFGSPCVLQAQLWVAIMIVQLECAFPFNYHHLCFTLYTRLVHFVTKCSCFPVVFRFLPAQIFLFEAAEQSNISFVGNSANWMKMFATFIIWLRNVERGPVPKAAALLKIMFWQHIVWV